MVCKKKKERFLENQYLRQYGQTYLCLTQASTLCSCLVLSKLLNLSKPGYHRLVHRVTVNVK